MKLGKRLSILGAIIYTSVFGTSFWVEKAEAQSSPRPYVVFVNGWQNCCSWGMNSLQNRLINEMDAEPRYVPYSNFNHMGKSKSKSTDEEFLRDGANFINNQLDRNRPLILIGHSFGGDSILKLLPRINRRIQFVGVIDPVSTGGVRSTLVRYTVPDTVDYFFNRWQENEPFPIDFRASGSIRCNARIRCDQDEQQFVTYADGNIHRENCKWFEACKTKNRRVDHQELATDAWIQRIIGDRVSEMLASSPKDRGYDNQWYFQQVGNYYQIKNRVSNLCLGVRGVDNHNAGTGVEVYHCSPDGGDAGNDNQWYFQQIAGDFRHIKNKASNLCLGVRGVDGHNPGTGTEVYHCNPGGSDTGNDNQWTLQQAEDGYWLIKNKVSNLCLGVRGVDNHRPGEEAEAYHCTP